MQNATDGRKAGMGMNYSQCAKRELQMLRQLYVAQVNLNKEMLAAQTDIAAGMSEAQKCGLPQDGRLKKRVEDLDLRIERVLNALCILDPEEQRIILLCYSVEGFTPEDIMELLHMEKSTFYRRKKSALEKFTRALYGVI